MHIGIVKDIEELNSIQPAWDLLCRDIENDVSVFDSYNWYKSWWHYYSEGALLNVVIMRESDKLVGIAPLMLSKSTRHGLTVTNIDFIENKNSPHNDFIVYPIYRDIFFREVLKTLQNINHKWDVIVCNNISVSSPTYGALVKILDEIGMKWHQETSYSSPYLIPSGDWTEYLAGRTIRTRKSLRNIQNKIVKEGEVVIRNIRTWEEYLMVRDDIFHVAKQSWTEKIGDSMASPSNAAFFDELARTAAEKGWLSVWTLELNGKLIAFEFHLRAYGKEHAMRGSYLPECAHLSPGTYLEMQILKNIFDNPDGVLRYDFGGSFDDYKRKWTDEAVPHCAITIFNDRIYSRFIAFHETKTVPLLKRVRDNIKHLRSSISK